MFNFSHLPYSTSNTFFSNEEVFGFILNICTYGNIPFYIEKEITFSLNIQKDSVFIL
jgi:hypothetical protein